MALACFVLLGLPTRALGVAWPYIRESFGLPLAALGGVLAPMTVTYLLSGAASGHMIGRFGLKRVLPWPGGRALPRLRRGETAGFRLRR